MNTSRMSLTINFKPRKTSKTAFIYCRIRLNGGDATDFTTHLPHDENWNQDSQLFWGEKYMDHNQTLANIADDIRILLKELLRAGQVSAHDLA